MRDPIYSEYPLISNYKGPDAGNRVVRSDIGKSEWREPGWIAWLAGENQRRQRICGCRRTVQNMNRDGLCAWIRRSIGRDSHSPRHTRGNGAFQVAGSRIAACPAHSLSRSAGCRSDNNWPAPRGVTKWSAAAASATAPATARFVTARCST